MGPKRRVVTAGADATVSMSVVAMTMPMPVSVAMVVPLRSAHAINEKHDNKSQDQCGPHRRTTPIQIHTFFVTVRVTGV